MTPPSPADDAPAEDWNEIETAIAALETQLSDLKGRFSQVQQDQTHLAQLKTHRQHLKDTQPPAWKTELRHLNSEIEALELNLESKLIDWQSFRQPFWQIVRFGGLGLVLGWILHALTQ
ncbi:MAG: DUF2203 domain-containing protein [Spirulina sp. SIO3F2]|nr:DUF2203 domain-containing protein [Spirulina sp. SIO3F2]